MPSAARRRATTRRKREAPETLAAPILRFRHRASGKERSVSTGFAWDLFLFAGVFGLPLFRRHLPYWGAAVLVLWLFVVGAGALPLGAATETLVQLALSAAFFVLQLWLGVFGNRLMARTLLHHGWTLEGGDAAAKRVAAKWKLA